MGEAMTSPPRKVGKSRAGIGNAGKGRKKGVPNKTTIRMKEALALLMDDMAPQMKALIEEIRTNDGPLAAWKCIMDVLEYNFPKLARTEHTGADGGPQEHLMSIAILPVKPRE